MTKLTKIDRLEIENLFSQVYFERKSDMLPTSIREVYSSIDGKKETLVAREVRGENGRLEFGISYVNGEPVEAYTADANGRRVPFVPVKASESVSEKPSKTQEFLTERFKKRIAQNGNEDKPKVRRVISRKMAEERTKKNLMAAAVQASKQETH